MRIAIPIVLATAALGLAAPGAQASVAAAVGGRLIVVGDTEANEIVVSRLAPNVYVVSDTASMIATGTCVPLGTNAALCTDPLTPITRIEVRTVEGDDTVTFEEPDFLRLGLAAPWPWRYVETGDGHDTVTNADEVYAGDGDDRVTGASSPPGPRVVDSGPGDDVVTATAASVVDGGDGDDFLYGSPEDDTLRGGGGADGIVGFGGFDVLEGGDGPDQLSDNSQPTNVLRGGAGDDYLYAVNSQTTDTVDCGAGGSDTAELDYFEFWTGCEYFWYR